LIGPQKTLRWSVPEGARDENGNLIHDDYLLADAHITEVDKLQWYQPSETLIIQGKDQLQEMDSNYG